jgi:hypothetical protein
MRLFWAGLLRRFAPGNDGAKNITMTETLSLHGDQSEAIRFFSSLRLKASHHDGILFPSLRADPPDREAIQFFSARYNGFK